MKIFIGIVLLALAAISFFGGLYLGLWVMLIGGIANAVEACKMEPVDSWLLATSIVRACLFKLGILAGVAGATFFGIFGVAAIADSLDSRFNKR